MIVRICIITCLLAVTQLQIFAQDLEVPVLETHQELNQLDDAATHSETSANIETIEEQNISQLTRYDNATDSLEETATAINNTCLVQNDTSVATKNTTKSNLAPCLPLKSVWTVEIVNATRLLELITSDPNITSKDTPASCVSVLFYSQSCPYSCRIAKAYNLLPKAFPNVKVVAIEAMTHHIFNAQIGIVGVPTMVLYHNGRILNKLPTNIYQLELIIKFIMAHVDGGVKDFDEARKNSYVTAFSHWQSIVNEMLEPLPTEPVYRRDYCLGLSWMFIIICGFYFFSKSKFYVWIIETIQNTWQESEAQAQHEHVE